MAGPFECADFDQLVPADKKLSPDWIKSLFDRGQPTVYRGEDLKHIGMPIGGIGAGYLYLGGDGKLWHWDIFNKTGGTGADHYANPMKPESPLEQGFAIRATVGGKTETRTRSDWIPGRKLSRAISDRNGRISGPRLSPENLARGIFSVHSTGHRRFESSGDRASLYSDQFIRGRCGGDARRLASECGPSGERYAIGDATKSRREGSGHQLAELLR